MHCNWGTCQNAWRRLDKGDSADDAAEAPELAKDLTDGQGSGLGEESEEAVSATADDDSDDTNEMRRANGGLGQPRPAPRPRPRPRHECWNAWDCPGTGEYCYQGWNGNYCRYDSGEGSICQRDSDCGWNGYMQMHCNWGTCQNVGWRRLDKGDSADDAAEAPGQVTDGQGSGLG